MDDRQILPNDHLPLTREEYKKNQRESVIQLLNDEIEILNRAKKMIRKGDMEECLTEARIAAEEIMEMLHPRHFEI